MMVGVALILGQGWGEVGQAWDGAVVTCNVCEFCDEDPKYIAFMVLPRPPVQCDTLLHYICCLIIYYSSLLFTFSIIVIVEQQQYSHTALLFFPGN